MRVAMHLMRLLGVVAVLSVQTAAAEELDTVVQGIESAYKGVQSLRADFVQVTHNAAMGLVIPSKSPPAVSDPSSLTPFSSSLTPTRNRYSRAMTSTARAQPGIPVRVRCCAIGDAAPGSLSLIGQALEQWKQACEPGA